MPYCITLRSRADARITGWYDGTDSRWSTDYKRQKLFDKKHDATLVCEELRRCPRNARAIKIEAGQNDPSIDRDAQPGERQFRERAVARECASSSDYTRPGGEDWRPHGRASQS
jgi:hypothetical protein